MPGMLTVYGRVNIPGITDQSEFTDPIGAVLGWVGYGPINTQPSGGGWTWTAATANAGYNSGSPGWVANEDEYQADMLLPAAGNYDYAYRFSGDFGQTFSYCDLNGGNYNLPQAGAMTTF